MSRHRASRVRPRYGRIAAAATSLMVTLVALLGGVGLLPSGGSQAAQPGVTASSTTPRPAAAAAPASASASASAATSASTPASTSASTSTLVDDASTVPADSGQGRRVVFSQARQRVWLVDDDERVRRTYLVSGSRLDNLEPGTYQVYSRSRWAVGIQDSGVMQYFVRFTRGPSGAAIGFHSIPTKDGQRLQTLRQLGTPQSHGCIRQRTDDAIRMWQFAPVGTAVDVVAA